MTKIILLELVLVVMTIKNYLITLHNSICLEYLKKE